MKIKNIIFDLDDTLVDSEGAYKDAVLKCGIQDEENYWAARAQVKKNLPSGHVSARNRFLYLKEYLQNKNDFSPKKIFELMDKMEQALFENLKQQCQALERDKLFLNLKKSGYSLGVLTNENIRTQTLKLKAIDPELKYFDFFVTSEEVGLEKPNKRIFDFFLNRSQWLPAETVFVGDNYENDIKGAMNCGLKAILTIEFHDESKLWSECVIQKLNQLEATLKRLNQ